MDKRDRKISPFFNVAHVDLIFTNNEIHFLPNKYSIFLGFNSIPTELNKRLYIYSVKRIAPNQIFLTWEKEIYENKSLIFEANIMKDKDSIDRLYSFIKDWENE